MKINMPYHPSDSSVQSQAEIEMLHKLEEQTKCTLSKEPIKIDNHISIEVDGHSKSEYILVEAYAHIGKLKGAQSRKVLTDAFKMLHAERLLGGHWRKILLFADEEVARIFIAGTWYAEAIKEFGIEIEVVSLEKETNKLVLEAQKRQAMQNINEGSVF